MSYQILNPGLDYWFSADGDAVVGYVQVGRYWLAAGAPIAPPERIAAVLGEFAAAAAQARCRACYFGVQQRLIDLFPQGRPIAKLLLGAQPVWDPQRWPAIIARKSSLRAQLARAQNRGVVVSRWGIDRARCSPALHSCLRAWLATRGMPPMHFVVEPDTLGNVEDRRVFVAEREGAVLGFLVASPMRLRQGWLIEQNIRTPSAPNGTTELLVDHAMRALAAEGATYVTLGLSPLSRAAAIRQPPQLPLVRLALAWARAHGQRFFNFEGLDSYKRKFQPDAWEPLYMVADGRFISLAMLYAIAQAFSGEPPAWFIGRALLRAIQQELAWAHGGLG